MKTDRVFEWRSSGGPKEVITRLADILFIRAVCAYFDRNIEAAELGWLLAVRDGQIGQALAMLHKHPQQAWTVDSLARHVALSRSAFAARFTELVGEPPLHYLIRLRIDLAAARLRSRDDKLRAIAAASGYESVAAFAKFFKRVIGMTPGSIAGLVRVGRGSPIGVVVEVVTIWMIGEQTWRFGPHAP